MCRLNTSGLTLLVTAAARQRYVCACQSVLRSEVYVWIVDAMRLNILASPSAITRARDQICWLTHFLPTMSRPSRNLPPPSMSSLNGTSMVPRPARLSGMTPMSTCAPSISSPTLSVRVITSSSFAKPGIRMAPPTSSTSVTMPTA